MCKVYNGAVQKYTSYMPKTLENTHFFVYNIIKKIMKERLSERQAEKKSVRRSFIFLQNGKSTEAHKKYKKRR